MIDIWPWASAVTVAALEKEVVAEGYVGEKHISCYFQKLVAVAAACQPYDDDDDDSNNKLQYLHMNSVTEVATTTMPATTRLATIAAISTAHIRVGNYVEKNYFLRKKCTTYYVRFLRYNIRLSCKQHDIINVIK